MESNPEPSCIFLYKDFVSIVPTMSFFLPPRKLTNFYYLLYYSSIPPKKRLTQDLWKVQYSWFLHLLLCLFYLTYFASNKTNLELIKTSIQLLQRYCGEIADDISKNVHKGKVKQTLNLTN